MKSEEAKRSFLYDYYGALLGERQQEIYELYYEDNLSLSEIAEELGVTRQAVHSALKKAAAALAVYEEKLGLIAKHEKFVAALKKIAALDDIDKVKRLVKRLDI
ncbi:MAG: HTH domain-containing protein [Clostridiales Family XIII bacterium]|jgi:predicted DNA-binding protein YlxM (UPF0122 family)|nr:HTH domain-containing protein [Clostridiales Family XIII bacterium]